MDTVIFNGNAIKTVGSIKAGDKVLVTTTTSGEKVACPLSSIKSGDNVTIIKLQNGDKMAVKSMLCVKITDGFDRNVNYNGEVVTFGPISFNWGGSGKVYISSSCTDLNSQIWADDSFSIVTQYGTVSYNFNPDGNLLRPIPALDITSIVRVGLNSVTVNIIDLYGAGIGCTPLFIITA